jgi:acetyltransferase-like isoleucine patch superfamily enzyme
MAIVAMTLTKTINIFQIKWVARYLLYRILYSLGGNIYSYCGCPIYHNGLRKLKVSGSLGIFPNWRMEFLGQGEMRVIGNVRIGHNFHAIVGADVILEDGVVIAPDVYLSTHESQLARSDAPVKERPIIAKPIHIKENAFIGKGAMIFPGVTIGRYAVIGAYAIVKSDVMDGGVFTALNPRKQ